MDELKNKIKEDIKKDACKNTPDDIGYVWKAIEEPKKPSRLNRLSLIAACVTFMILVAAVTGIILMPNGGLFGDNSAVSGALHPETSEETVTFAEMHPELATLPEDNGIRFIYADSNAYEDTEQGENAAKIYSYVFAPGSSLYIENTPDNLPADYWTVELKSKGEVVNTFRLYIDGHFTYIEPSDTGNAGKYEWFYNPGLFRVCNGAESFATEHPDCVPDKEKLDLTITVQNEIYGCRKNDIAENIFKYFMKDGSLPCFDFQFLPLPRTDYARIIFAGTNTAVSCRIYTMGLVEYYISYNGNSSKNVSGFFFNYEGYDFECFKVVPEGKLSEKHPELLTLPEGYNISYAVGNSDIYTQVPQAEAAQWYQNVLKPEEALYLNADSGAYEYIWVRLVDGNGNIKYSMRINSNGMFLIETDGVLEWYKGPKAEWSFTATTFSDINPLLTVIPEDTVTVIGKDNGSFTLTGKDIEDIWEKAIDGGNALCADKDTDIINKLLLDTQACYYITWEDGYSYCAEIYENGLIRFAKTDPLAVYDSIPYEYYMSDTGAEAYLLLVELTAAGG
ncbi:MAG: hypothetical protein PHW77_00650 [Eubacteriales bacterium]|nr:hypothetical protein [Eubacteriales bacterium]